MPFLCITRKLFIMRDSSCKLYMRKNYEIRSYFLGYKPWSLSLHPNFRSMFSFFRSAWQILWGERQAILSPSIFLRNLRAVFDFSRFLLNSDSCRRLNWHKIAYISPTSLANTQIPGMHFAFFCPEGSLYHHSAQLASSSEPYLHFQPCSPWGLFLTIVRHIQNVKRTLNSVSKLHQ